MPHYFDTLIPEYLGLLYHNNVNYSLTQAIHVIFWKRLNLIKDQDTSNKLEIIATVSSNSTPAH